MVDENAEVRAIEIDLDSTDRDMGIVDVTAILYARTATVIVQGADGIYGAHTVLAWPGSELRTDDAIAFARRKARERLTSGRVRRAEHLARKAAVAACPAEAAE